MDYTPEDFMVVCISRQIRDGEIVVQGLATPLVAAGFLLARYTHAPHLYFASAIGQSVCSQPAPLAVSTIESLWLDRSLTGIGFVRTVTEVLPRLRPLEFFRPGQIDPYGNTNNIAMGKDYIASGGRQVRLRLPGSGGIPDVTTFISDIHLYVPRHSRVTFVPRLDVVSGLGHNPARTHGQGPRYLITDLGQFDFNGTGQAGNQPKRGENADSPSEQMASKGYMRLVTYHPGVSVEYIQAHTGFQLDVAPDVAPTKPPTEEEIRLLREVIDPLGIRRLESLSGAERRQLLHEILKQESNLHEIALAPDNNRPDPAADP